MKQIVRQKYHNYLKTVHVLINYAKSTNTKYTEQCKKKLQEMFGGRTIKKNMIWRRFCRITGYSND